MHARKHAREILISHPTTNIDKIFEKKLNKPSHNIRQKNTKDYIKSVNFAIVHIPEANVQLIEKFVKFAIKITILKFASHLLVKKYMKLKRANLMNLPTRALMNFLLKLLIVRSPHILTKSRMKTVIGQ